MKNSSFIPVLLIQSVVSFDFTDQGVASKGNAQRSSPYQQPTFHAINRAKAIKNIIGFVLTVPASKKDIFITAPKKAAIPVKNPTIRPSPTRTSPQATMYEKGTAFEIGRAHV